MSEVVNMGRPVHKQHVYRNHNISITFTPEKRIWHWEISYTITRRLGDDAQSYMAALNDAKRFVDKVLDT